MKKLIAIALIITYLIFSFKINTFPPSLNADEAAFGYNAYSLLKTARDEYGFFLPLRLKSFGDYKLPLYSYLSIPFIKIFGLNEFSTRLLAKFTGLFLIVAIYYLTYILFKKKVISLIALAFAVFSPWIQIFSNQAHETTLSTLFIAISLATLLSYIQTKRLGHLAISYLTLTLSLYSYHSAKIVFPFLFLAQIYYFWKNTRFKLKFKKQISAIVIVVLSTFVLISFAYSEIKTPANRVKNLLLFTHPNISLITNEARTESRFSPYGSPIFVGFKEFISRYISYFSPEFLVNKGDENPRFGYNNLSPINYLEYLFFIIGLYYIIKNKQPYRYLVFLILLTVPLAGSLSWQQYALSRTHALIIIILPIASYGLYQLLVKKPVLLRLSIVISVLLSISSLYFLYFNYPKRGLATRAWQAGYKELVNYSKTNYSKYKQFYITPKNGQPYIMYLFYLKYEPLKYQNQAKLSPLDEYGFGQVIKFDKFKFQFKTPNQKERASFIGYPDDFSPLEISQYKFKDIDVNNQVMFKILDQF